MSSTNLPKGSARRNRRAKAQRPAIRSGGIDSCVVTHKEYVREFLAGEFSQKSFEVNPGNPEMFPWLSAIALRYEFYRFRKLTVRFVCTGGLKAEYGNRELACAFEYDALDPRPLSKRELLNYRGAKSLRLSDGEIALSTRDCDRFIPRRFTRVRSRPGEDPRLANAAVLYVQATGIDGAAWAIYVDYVVELSIPQMFTEGESFQFENFSPDANRLFSKGDRVGTLSILVPETGKSIQILEPGEYEVHTRVEAQSLGGTSGLKIESANGRVTDMSNYVDHQSTTIGNLSHLFVPPGKLGDLTPIIKDLIPTRLDLKILSRAGFPSSALSPLYGLSAEQKREPPTERQLLPSLPVGRTDKKAITSASNGPATRSSSRRGSGVSQDCDDYNEEEEEK